MGPQEGIPGMAGGSGCVGIRRVWRVGLGCKGWGAAKGGGWTYGGSLSLVGGGGTGSGWQTGWLANRRVGLGCEGWGGGGAGKRSLKGDGGSLAS